MRENSKLFHGKRSEKGATLYIVALSMFVLLGISALAIDLVSFYLARAEAQRAADAGALAGASEFVTVGCTSTGGCSAGGSQEAPATTQAIAIASQNLVAGQAPSSSTVATSFSYPSGEEPQIKVTVYRDTGHSNALPTYFGKILGINTVNVSAFAWAEAYNPSAGSASVGVGCIRPFLVGNCDPNHPVSGSSPNANPVCETVSANTCTSSSTDCQSYYFNPTTGAIVNPGDCNWSTATSKCTGPGVVGAYWQLHDENGPSQWNSIAFTGQSGSAYEKNIYTCSPQVIACNASLNTLNGKKVGPTDSGIETLINASGLGLNQGQDEVCQSTAPYCTGAPPFAITGGSGNPDPNLVGKTFYSGSTSITNVVVYNGAALSPGGSTVTVVGYMQLFIQDVQHNGPQDFIEAIVMQLGGCGTTSASPPPVVSEGGSFIPIRLIHQ